MAVEPSEFEQLLLEYMNRSRMDPSGEFDWLITDAATVTGVQPNITSALRYFGVDPEAFRSQMAAFDPVAPLAWNSELATAADAHTELMIINDAQSHQLDGELPLGDRISAAGYTDFSSVAENIYSYTEDPLQGHAGFIVDWGYDAEDFDGTTLLPDWQTLGDGIQDPPGHRITILSASYVDVGISVIAETDSATRVGPYVVTQNFGSQFTSVPKLVGVAINDGDGDRFYDMGEGLGGLMVTAVGSTGQFTTTTWASGGYQMVLPAGSYTVTFEGAQLNGVAEYRVIIGAQNVKLDAFAADAGQVTPIFLEGTERDEVLTGTSGNDTLLGNAGDDTVDGAGGDDFVAGGEGNDSVLGGDGNDVLYLGLGNDVGGGGYGDDLIYGGAGANTIYGWFGSDTVQGGTESDTIIGGGDAQDTGSNQLFGNGGNDNILTGTAGDLVGGGTGNDTIRGNVGDDTLYGSLGNDDLAGGGGNDVILAGDGGDTIYAGLGDDFVGGGTGIDVIFAGAGANRIYLGEGDDHGVGGFGRDVFTGGPGADTFYFHSAGQIGIGAARSVITDFEAGTDRINFSALNTQFNDASGLIGGGTTSFYYFAASGLLIGDQDGNAVADWVLELSGAPAVTASDFVL
jgi:Ca2+-binding RTX toxin-like protein